MQSLAEVLEFDKLLNHLESCCQTGYGRILVHDETLTKSSIDEIQHEMARVDEAKILILRYGDISLSEPSDIIPLIQRLEKQGEIHSVEELRDILVALKQLRQLVRFFIQHRSKEETPTLLPQLEEITLPNPIVEQLENLVSPAGELLDSASEEYYRLKQRISEKQISIKRYLQGLITNHSISKCLQEPIITEREGRSVLPVKVEHKANIPGIVHSVSSTGITLYIEPKGVIEQNNHLIALKGDLEREIRRILKEISNYIYLEASYIKLFISQTSKLDLLLGKARQSIILKANPVKIIGNTGELHLRQARHPLLELQLEYVVPNDIFLHPPNKVLLITGPNTGGKTVILKLIGLFAMMIRIGLHLPVQEGSSMSIFVPVLADIGDPQSITQNLSTFSGHMERLKSFLCEDYLSSSLILIDEICAGTDPEEGSALAQALLETFYRRGATLIVTTHIGELKVFAHQQPGYLNASVEFDAESLSPTYRLILGVPGASNALNIAARLGIPDEVIDIARERLSLPVSTSAQLIESLEMKNRQLSEKLEETKKLNEKARHEEEQIRKQLNTIEREKKKTLQLYKEGLREKLRGIEQEVDDLKKVVINNTQANRETIRNFSGKFKKIQGETRDLFTEESSKLYLNEDINWENLKIGDIVESRSLNFSGIVIDKNQSKKEITLQSGILKTTIPFSDIMQKIGSQQPEEFVEKQWRIPYSKSGSLSMECDLRGMTVDDAINMMEKYIDDAMSGGIEILNVIHGLGTGRLKKAIRKHLEELPYVKSFRPSPANEGGDGKTIVTL